MLVSTSRLPLGSLIRHAIPENGKNLDDKTNTSKINAGVAFGTVRNRINNEQESLALASRARDDPPACSTATAMRGKVGSEFET